MSPRSEGTPGRWPGAAVLLAALALSAPAPVPAVEPDPELQRCGDTSLVANLERSSLVLALPGVPARLELDASSPGVARAGQPFATADDWPAAGWQGDGFVREGTIAPGRSGLTASIAVGRHFTLERAEHDAVVLTQHLELGAEAALPARFTVLAPLLRLPEAELAQVFYPRQDGRGLVLEASARRCAAFALGADASAGGCVPLALPIIDLLLADGRRVALHADPFGGATFTIERAPGELLVALSFTVAGDRVPFQRTARTVAIVLHGGGPEPALDAFFAAHAPERGPAWTRDVALVHFDYLGDGGKGWKRDLEALAARIAPAERARVAVALHGWYDRIGAYAFDPGRGEFLPSWTAQKRRGAVAMSVEEVRRRLSEARALGFRTLLYFADGMVADSATAMGARASAELGRTSWNGPEVEGELRVQNPADPVVRRWFVDYLDAVLTGFGDLLDGLVWDETFWVRWRAIATRPEPAHADLAMMSLTRLLAARSSAFRADLAFLASDALGYDGIDAPPYAAMAHGNFQDSESSPWAWSWGLFPSWRAPLWSVNWGAVTRFEDTHLGTLRCGAPVSLANGWADDQGPAEMPDPLLARAIELFEWRARHDPRPLWLDTEPAAWLAAPLPGELVPGSWRVAPARSGDPPAEDDALWRAAATDPLRFLDLGRALARDASAPELAGAAWAESSFLAPGNVAVELVAGSHGPLRIWLDGREVVNVREPRRHQHGSDRVPGLELRAGPHRLLVRTERTGPGFGFSLRLLGPLTRR